MSRFFVRAAVATLMLGAFPGLSRAAIIAIDFDQAVAGTAGGTLAYNGSGGPIVGTAIHFNTVSIDLNDDSVIEAQYACVPDCLLDFTSGNNSTEGPVYTWLPGGSFTLTGTIIDPSNGNAVVSSGTVLIGTFANPNGPNGAAGFFTGTGASAEFDMIGGGDDIKNPDFLAYIVADLNLSAINPDFAYVNSNFTASGCNPDAGGGFSCAGKNADLHNTGTFTIGEQPPVPEPGSMFLLGSGLLGLAGAARRRFTR